MAQFKIEDYPKDNTVTLITKESITIKVNNYVSIEAILDAIQSILSLSLSPMTGMYLPGHLEVYKTLYSFYLFTDLEFLEEEKENPMDLYNALVCAPFYEEVRELLNKNKSYIIFNLILENTAMKMEKYQTSAYGIFDSLKKDYNNLDMDIETLQKKIQNKEGIELVDEIVKKLG